MSEQSLNGGRALVTGASGFIGMHLLDRLRADGVEIHAVSRNAQPAAEQVRWHALDLVDPEAVRRLVGEVAPDVVFHLAGDSRAARGLDLVGPTFAANLASTVNLLTAVAEHGAARVLLAGSLEEPEPDAAEPPSSPYAASKLAARSYAEMFGAVFGIPVVVLRIFMAYGPRQRDVRKLVPYVILSLLRGEAPQLTSGLREVDWVYVGDIADAFAAAATAETTAAVDVGSGTTCSIRSLVERLVELIDPEIVPAFGAVADRPSEQIRAADVGAAARTIGWRPQVELEEGLRRTVNWYREELGRGAS
jgi:UDP-glucose 4-epimerase